MTTVFKKLVLTFVPFLLLACGEKALKNKKIKVLAVDKSKENAPPFVFQGQVHFLEDTRILEDEVVFEEDTTIILNGFDFEVRAKKITFKKNVEIQAFHEKTSLCDEEAKSSGDLTLDALNLIADKTSVQIDLRGQDALGSCKTGYQPTYGGHTIGRPFDGGQGGKFFLFQEYEPLFSFEKTPSEGSEKMVFKGHYYPEIVINHEVYETGGGPKTPYNVTLKAGKPGQAPKVFYIDSYGSGN